VSESFACVRVGVVGLGYWGPNIVRVLHDVEGAQVAWACDTRPERLDPIRRRYPAVAVSERYEDLLADADLDAVVIATPVSSHFPLAVAALEAEKHVFVEKPLAGSSEEAGRLIELADERGLLLMPGHTFLYSPPVNHIRELIHAGELGDVYFVSTSRVNLGLHQPDVSVAWDLGPHDFSILRYWLDETPSFVSALARGCILPDTPDVAFINLDFASGTIAHVELAWLAPSKLRRTTVVGSRRMVVYSDGSPEPVRVFDSGVMVPDPATFGEYQLTYRTGDIVSPHVEAVEPLRLELEDFCSSVATGEPVRSSAELGFEVVKMVEAVEASLAVDGARVPVAGDPAARVRPSLTRSLIEASAANSRKQNVRVR
jgi:predicted dehydrogenase